ncbi:hypothetical protein [Chishuiella sp.]|uniref:hypothetical protein n=1 Tax=Chishuiella sp. TaxID=1969467 RepID=UPI0028ADE1D6|nr:hypothetical protein [Chishuiella sp.]
MKYFDNKSESFFREIRKVIIYKASSINYINNLRGTIPQLMNAIYSFEVVPESFSYKIATKTQNKNYLFELEVNFPLLDLSIETVDFCFDSFNRDDFAIVFQTNSDQLLFGNDREPIKVEFIDNKKLDNSGNDEYTIALSGKSIIKPKYNIL